MGLPEVQCLYPALELLTPGLVSLRLYLGSLSSAQAAPGCSSAAPCWWGELRPGASLLQVTQSTWHLRGCDPCLVQPYSGRSHKDCRKAGGAVPVTLSQGYNALPGDWFIRRVEGAE